MKDFFESIKKGAYVGSKIVVDKTKDVLNTSKREIDIQKIKYEINKDLRQIGMLKYKEKIGEIDDASDLINKLLEEVENKMSIMERLKEGEQTKKDKDNNKDEDEYGDYENKKIIKPEKNNEGYYVMRFCNYCNIGNHPEATHCVHCGRRLS